MYSSPPIPVLEIAQDNGVDVVFADFKDRAEDVSGFCDLERRRIYVNHRDMPKRQSFTMAHELGHWLLHKAIFDDDPDTYRYLPRFATPRHNDLEREANKFAAHLLVPERLLRPVRTSRVSALADAFFVSRSMMEIRLRYK